jgi:hypothetical protein
VKRRAPGATLFRLLDIEAADVARHATVIDDLRERRLDGLIVRGALPAGAAAAAVARLERGDTPLRRATFPGFPEVPASPHVFGRAIVACPPDLTEYFAEAAAFRSALPSLFAGDLDFEARLSSIFSVLAGGRPASVPAGPGGGTYTPATIRVLPEGHQIGVHVGNAFLRLPQARHLATLVEVDVQLSYFVPLTLPEAGGELVVYALEWSDTEAYLPPAGEASGDLVYDASDEAIRFIELCDREVFRPGEGDLLIFDGGRYYHRVTPVRGGRPRRTLGGFVALTRDRAGVGYWS